jgi:hypothetical protein
METLTHTFVDCPAAAPVVDWMLALWAALTPGHAPPPRSAALIVADDYAAGGWSPPVKHAELWGRLRVAVLGCLWHTRCHRAAFGNATASACAARTAAAVVDHLRAAIRRDWLRATVDVRKLSEDWYSDWFRGRNPALEESAFLDSWGFEGRLCRVANGQLEVLLSCDAPVPIPGGVVALAL